jgi:transcriptional regulator with XRE-family HTH domain
MSKLFVVEQLILARKSWKLSVEEVSKRTGCNKSTIHHIECGDKNPSGKILIKWAEALGYDLVLRPKPLKD